MRRAGRAAAAVIAGFALMGILAGCTDPAPEEPVAQVQQDIVVPLAELENTEIDLAEGDVLRVIVDTPGVVWTAESSQPDVLGLVDPGSGDETRVVTLTAVKTGTSVVTFRGEGDEEYTIVREFEVAG